MPLLFNIKWPLLQKDWYLLMGVKRKDLMFLLLFKGTYVHVL